MITTLKNSLCGIIKIIFMYLHLLIDIFTEFIFGLIYNKKGKKVPPVKNTLLLNSTIVLAQKIRERKVSAEEVVSAFIKRCKEVNGIINAVVDVRYKEAIKEAQEIDKMLLDENLNIKHLEETQPLLGVPFTTKESNAAKGMLHSAGTLSRKGIRATEDATVIENVKKAGAIIIAKTNIPELNQWVESRNLIYGQTNNPYDTNRLVGGSSGGDGAIVAACGVPFAVGSDIGGSIRMPASYNGVYGFKPSQGMTPKKGIGLRNEECSNSMVEAGPICKKAEDLELLTRIMAGSNLKHSLNSSIDIKHINVFYQQKSGDIRASEIDIDSRNALINAVMYLEDICKNVKKIKLPGSEYSYRLWRYWMTQEDLHFRENLTNNTGTTSFQSEFWKLLTGNSKITLAALLKLLDADVFPLENAEWAESVTRKMKTYLIDKLGDDGVLLYPSYSCPKYHYQSYLSPFSFGYWALFNVLKVPVCQIPMGLNRNGLPIGIQVVAAPNNDHLCITIAKELEKKFHWVEP